MSKLGGDSHYPVLLQKNKTSVIAVKNYAEAVNKVFCSCLTLLDFFYFVPNVLSISKIKNRFSRK